MCQTQSDIGPQRVKFSFVIQIFLKRKILCIYNSPNIDFSETNFLQGCTNFRKMFHNFTLKSVHHHLVLYMCNREFSGKDKVQCLPKISEANKLSCETLIVTSSFIFWDICIIVHCIKLAAILGIYTL
jgi:hypothetical protein